MNFPEFSVELELGRDSRGKSIASHKFIKECATASVLSKHRHVPAYSLAIVYLGLGDKEEALRRLKKVIKIEPALTLARSELTPFSTPLRAMRISKRWPKRLFRPRNLEKPQLRNELGRFFTELQGATFSTCL